MKSLSLSLALAAASLASLSHALIFNKTAAYAPGQYDKYKCINTEDVNAMFPKCLRQCQRDANAGDGCAYNDFACHCANYDVYSPLIENCAFPPSLGGTGSCSLADLGKARVVVTDLCNFFNATLYTATAECQGSGGRWCEYSAKKRDLSPEKTFALIAGQEITILDQ